MLGPKFAALLSVVTIMSVAACSPTNPSEPPASSALEAAPSHSATAAPQTWSMTGLPIPADRSPRPILAVKVDNTASGQPQQGIDRADLVVQGPVEGGATRLAAFFESKTPRIVGPVRSIRTSDVGVVKPAEAIVVASGGAPVALNTMARARVKVHTEGSAGLYRDPTRSAPYNLFANVATVAESVAGKPPEEPYLVFGASESPAGVAAGKLVVTFSTQSREEWRFSERSGSWRRSGQQAGGKFSAVNLLMLQVKLRDAGYKDPAGNFVPEVVTTGSGRGWFASGPQVQRIRWSKSSPAERWEVTNAAGARIELPPGRSWISLLPRSTGEIERR
jgi:hypothetical protein